jgi:acyl-CoA hydrolase
LGIGDVGRFLRPGLTVYAPGLSGESGVFWQALEEASDAAAGVRFIGVWLPGINRRDYAGLHPAARATAFFVGPDLRPSFEAGRIDFLPLSYSATYGFLRDRAAIDVALLQVSPPDPEGRVSLGVANDFSPAVLDKAPIILAHINPRMPFTRGAATLSLDRIHGVIEADGPLLSDGPEKDDGVFRAIGHHIAQRVGDGDTIEVGVGRVQGIVPALSGHRRIRVHSGAITTPFLALVRSGSLAEDPGSVTIGVALGSDDLYRFAAEDPRVRFAPVGETHDIATLRRIPRFIAINSVLEVDLFGQANAEMVDGRQVSSAGGITDFMRGARLAEGGVGIVALPATARGGAVSRIVPALAPGTAVSIARGDMDVVVTEYGVADLRNRSIDDRARSLIDIAAPPFRDGLAAAWDARRRAM